MLSRATPVATPSEPTFHQQDDLQTVERESSGHSMHCADTDDATSDISAKLHDTLKLRNANPGQDKRSDGRLNSKQTRDEEGNTRKNYKHGSTDIRRTISAPQREPYRLKNATSSLASRLKEYKEGGQAVPKLLPAAQQVHPEVKTQSAIPSQPSINTALARSSKNILELVAQKMQWATKEVYPPPLFPFLL
jgi:hypothetical protein